MGARVHRLWLAAVAISVFSSQAMAQPASAPAPEKPSPPSPQPALAPQPPTPAPPAAVECETCPEERNWPDGKGAQKKVHLFAAAQMGSCTRDGSEVGGADLCGDVTPLGLDVPFRVGWSTLRFDLEVSFGAMNRVVTGDAFGIQRSAGGAYLALRPMIGLDITRRFFVRVGPQLRATYSLDTVAPGITGVLDLGTRLGSHVEIGPRGFLGADDVIVAAPEGTRHELAVAFGATLFARVFVL